MKQLILMSLLIVGLISINTACRKEKAKPEEPIDLTPKLPEATKIGANTFGCYINGELFVAATKNPFAAIDIYCSYNSISENELRVEGTTFNDSVYEAVSFRSYVTESDKTFLMDVIGAQRGFVNLVYSPTADCFDFDHEESNPGSVFISHLDTVKRIISGTFEMDLVNDDCEPYLLKITEGRFDMTY